MPDSVPEADLLQRADSCMTTAVIAPCHNTKHDFPNRSPRRTHLRSNQSNPSELITHRQLHRQLSFDRVALPARSLNHTHLPD